MKHFPAVAALVAFTGFWLSPGVASAVTVFPSPVADNTIYSESGTVSNGAGDFLFAGNTLGNQTRRALIRFDVSGIPSGAVITTASLTLFMSRSIAGPASVNVHRLNAPFGEAGSNAPGNEGAGTAAAPGDATWTDNILGTSPWAVAGGDFAAGPSATQTVAAFGSYTWSGAGLVADIQAWVDGSSANDGWILLGDEASPGTAKRFNSRNNLLNTPQLVVDYIPEPSSAALVLLAGLAAIRRRR